MKKLAATDLAKYNNKSQKDKKQHLKKQNIVYFCKKDYI